ncbi:hypothetical protein B0J14DRAFT_682024 [Halenospora varia]|nr:hypothetical protein B0J14DRAFT_682024 [Halenospora varia]
MPDSSATAASVSRMEARNQEASSILLHGGTIIAFDDATQALKVLRGGSLLIVNDRIQTLYDPFPNNTTLPHDTHLVNCTNKIISPGFVDTHHHGWQTTMRTIGANTNLPGYFAGSLSEYGAMELAGPDDVYIGQLMGFLESMNAGTTTTLDHAHGTWGDASADAGMKGSIDSGARVFFAHTVHPLKNNYTIAQQVAKLKCFARERVFAGTNVELGLAYDYWGDGSADDVNQLVEAIKTTNLSVITTHFLGGPWKFNNSPQLIHSYGLLNTSTPWVFSHASFVQPMDMYLLRSTNQYISTLAESESHYGHSNNKVEMILDQDSIGVDTHFTYSTDMMTQARMWLQTVRHRFYDDVVVNHWNVSKKSPMSVTQGFLLATRNGGLALRRPDLGVIKEGAKADIVVFDGMTPGLLGWVDPVAAIMLHSSVADIEHVIINGKFMKKNGKLTYPHYGDLKLKFLESSRRVQDRYKKATLPVLHGAYNEASMMEDPMEADVLRGEGTGYGVDFL